MEKDEKLRQNIMFKWGMKINEKGQMGKQTNKTIVYIEYLIKIPMRQYLKISWKLLLRVCFIGSWWRCPLVAL